MALIERCGVPVLLGPMDRYPAAPDDTPSRRQGGHPQMAHPLRSNLAGNLLLRRVVLPRVERALFDIL